MIQYMQIFIVMIVYLFVSIMLSNILIFFLTFIVFVPFKKWPKWRPFLFLILFLSWNLFLLTNLCLCFCNRWFLLRLIVLILTVLNGFLAFHSLHFFHQLENHFFVSYLVLIPLIKFISNACTYFVVNRKSYIWSVTEVQVCQCTEDKQFFYNFILVNKMFSFCWWFYKELSTLTS